MTGRRSAVVLGLLLFASYAYFYQAGGWNQNSRFALDRAILERSTLQIDAYQLHTQDRALWKGHYYSDKAPGQSLLALPVAAVARVIARACGVSPESFPGIAWTSYAATVATSGVLTVAAALLIAWFALRCGMTRGSALFAAVGYGLASPGWAYATLFMGHAQAAGLLMVAFAAAVAFEDADEARRVRLAWMLGLAGGWAVVTEFQAGVPAILIGLLALDGLRQGQGGRKGEAFASIAAGIVVAAIPMLVYNTIAFGSPTHLGYQSEEGFKELHTGFFGITIPEWWRVRELLVGGYRGLLPIAPALGLAPAGLLMLMRGRATRGPAVVALAIPVYYLLLNASYYYWEGGWAYGPRQMMAGLPFLCIGLAPLWNAAGRPFRVALLCLCVYGVAVNLVAVATSPQPPSDIQAPLAQFMWPAFKDGDLSLNNQSFVHGAADAANLRGGRVPHAAWNLGQLAGLPGLWSLAPLMLLWVGAGLMLTGRRRPEKTPL